MTASACSPGDDPAEFVYYPVLLKATTRSTLDSVMTDHTQGVVGRRLVGRSGVRRHLRRER